MGTGACLLWIYGFAILPRCLPRGGFELSDKKTDVIKSAAKRDVHHGQMSVPQQRLGVTDSQQRKIGNGRDKGMLLEISAKVFRIHSDRCCHIAYRNPFIEI